MPFGSHFARFQSCLKNEIAKTWKPVEKLNSASTLLIGRFENMVKHWHFRVRF